MSNYIFKFPKDMPFLDSRSIDAYLGKHDERKVGTTIRIQRLATLSFAIYLYDCCIAFVGDGSVTFLPDGDDAHRATTHWIAAIARHNGIIGWIGRRRRRKSDGPGPLIARGQAGVLEIGASPVENHTFTVNLQLRSKTLWASEREELENRNGK